MNTPRADPDVSRSKRVSAAISRKAKLTRQPVRSHPQTNAFRAICHRSKFETGFHFTTTGFESGSRRHNRTASHRSRTSSSGGESLKLRSGCLQTHRRSSMNLCQPDVNRKERRPLPWDRATATWCRHVVSLHSDSMTINETRPSASDLPRPNNSPRQRRHFRPGNLNISSSHRGIDADLSTLPAVFVDFLPFGRNSTGRCSDGSTICGYFRISTFLWI